MKWSLRVGRVFGIDLFVHATFLILLAWIGASTWMQTHDAMQAAAGIGFIALVFGIVVLHELGHALTARHFGIRTRDIMLLPIGGVARLERMPEDPRQEVLVGLAGPAVNIVLAVLLAGGLAVAGRLDDALQMGAIEGSFVARLLWVNVALAGFNLLPAFPMDGGRVLRALLSMHLDRVRATRLAAGLGRGLAVMFGLLGLLGNPMLVLIALFVWMGAGAESGATELSAAIRDLRVADGMITRFDAVRAEDTLEVPVAHVLRGEQTDFPVLQGDRVVGVLGRDDLIRALAARGQAATVASAMQTDFRTARIDEPLAAALERLADCKCRTMPVSSAHGLVGMLTPENITEVFLIGSALRDRAAHAASTAGSPHLVVPHAG